MTIPARSDTPPTVVLVAQLGTGGDSWKPVVDRLPDAVTFTYDRPGTGAAPGRPAPNPPLPYSVFARELADLLDERGITGRAVVVGHSFGGLIARMYAAHHPDRVAGLVIVDGSIPQFHLLPGEGPKIDGDGPDATEIDTVTGHVEILTAAVPDVPAVVMTRTRGRWSGDAGPPHPAVDDLWHTHQQILARDLQAPLIVADDCGHQLPRDMPDLVAHAIQEVLDAVETGRRPRPNRQRLDELGAHLDDSPGTGLPVGSIVAFRDSVAYRDDENPRFPWSETSAGSYTDSYVREMLDGGYAVVVRRGFDGAPPEPPAPIEE